MKAFCLHHPEKGKNFMVSSGSKVPKRVNNSYRGLACFQDCIFQIMLTCCSYHTRKSLIPHPHELPIQGADILRFAQPSPEG